MYKIISDTYPDKIGMGSLKRRVITMATLITPSKREQLERFVGDAARKAALAAARDEFGRADGGIDDVGAQLVIERGGEFTAAVRATVRATVAEQLRRLSVRGRFAREEVTSTYDYPPEYRGPISLDNQASILRAAFPELGDYNHGFASSLGAVEGTEGPFIVPCWDKLARTYGEALERVFRVIASTRVFQNYREGQLGPRFLHQHEHAVAKLNQAAASQQADLLVLPGQFGKDYRGRSVRRARELLAPNEFGATSFAIACLILTHPTRFVRWEQLHVDCAGDEFAPEAGGEFSNAPYFFWSDGQLGFYAIDVSYFSPFYGSASFRLPE